MIIIWCNECQGYYAIDVENAWIEDVVKILDASDRPKKWGALNHKHHDKKKITCVKNLEINIPKGYYKGDISKMEAIKNEFLIWTEVVNPALNRSMLLGPYIVKEDDIEKNVENDRLKYECYEPMPGEVYKFTRDIILGPIGVRK